MTDVVRREDYRSGQAAEVLETHHLQRRGDKAGEWHDHEPEEHSPEGPCRLAEPPTAPRPFFSHQASSPIPGPEAPMLVDREATVPASPAASVQTLMSRSPPTA